MNRRSFLQRISGAILGTIATIYSPAVSKASSVSIVPPLKDTTQYHQMLMQLHDKEVISTRTLLKEMGWNYDEILALNHRGERW